MTQRVTIPATVICIFMMPTLACAQGDKASPPNFEQHIKPILRACETKTEPTLSQTLHLAVGDTLRSRLGANGRITNLLQANETPASIIADLFVLALSREPTPEESSSMRSLVSENSADAAAYEDGLWGLLNSTEFAFNH
jgi:hypothetical protein